MKKMKLYCIVLFFIFIYANTYTYAVSSSDLSSTDLIGVGSGSYEIIVSKTTTVDEISAVLGEPKLTTPSAFGGYAYTWYTDDEYSNYLYIETLNDGTIISYGSIDETFVTRTYSYGSSYPWYASGFTGYFVNTNSDPNYVYGGIFYNYKAISNKYAEVVTYFEDIYLSNSTYYLKGIVQQGILMYNAYSYKLGKDASLEWNEEFFYINEQLKELDSSVLSYLTSNSTFSSYAKALGSISTYSSSPLTISSGNYTLLNPLEFASFAIDNLSTNFGDKTIAVFDFDYDNAKITAIAVSEDTFEQIETVELTSEEKTKRDSAREMYAQAIEEFDSIGSTTSNSIYTTTPVTTTASGLVAGELKSAIKAGVTDYVNAIRIGAGANELTAVDSNFECAQYIATLLSYRLSQLGLAIAHQPSQPDGVSDDFYYTATGKNSNGVYLGLYVENLYSSASSSTTVNMIKRSIVALLDDSTVSTLGHRIALLYPTYTEFGYGISPYVASNEFSGYSANSTVLSGWPAANGVTFLETLSSKYFYWTAQFYSGYTITSSTTATIQCLNTGDTWEFTTETSTSSKVFQRHTSLTSYYNNKVVMYDSTIVPQAGYVYLVTLHDVTNSSTGATEDYSYRAAFEYADPTNYSTTTSSVEIDTSNLQTFPDETTVYRLPVGKEVKLNAVLDDSATNKKVTWYSSSSNVTVTQNGILYATENIEDEYIYITLVYDNDTSITDQIVLKTYTALESVELTASEITLDADQYDEKYFDDGEVTASADIEIKYVPDDATESTKITWEVAIDGDINGTYYGIDKSRVQTYVTVVVEDQDDPKKVTVTVHNAQEGISTYYLKCTVEGYDETYYGICTINVVAPITGISDMKCSTVPKNSGGMTTSVANKTIALDYDLFGYTTFVMTASVTPAETSYSTEIEWTSNNESVVVSNGDGSFEIVGTGTAVITATSVGNPNFYVSYTLTVTATITKLTLTDQKSSTVNTSTTSDVVRTVTLTRTPTIATSEKVTVTSSNEKIAGVTDNGDDTYTITFYSQGGEGTVKITASNEDGSCTTTLTYTVYELVHSMSFEDSEVSLNKGETDYVTLVTSPGSYYNKSTYRTFTSSDTSVVTVDSNGLITAVGAGTATITATIPKTYTDTGSAVTATCTVTVLSPLTDVTLSSSKTMIIGSTYSLTPTLTPSDTTDTLKYKWKSYDTSIVEIESGTTSQTAQFTAVGLGTTTIECVVTNKTTYKTYTLTMSVTVSNYLKGDMNKDGKVNAEDAAIVLDRYKNNDASDEDYAIGDMNEDGRLNAEDAAMILDVYKNG